MKTDYSSESFPRPVPFMLKQEYKAERRNDKSRKVKFKKKKQIWLQTDHRLEDKVGRRKKERSKPKS
jgi:hypothetical protein